uniref:Uncharacterized protein n=1 Tax=Mycobacterium riyadhense TaxID=486698 RepID=A0A653EZY9_9MYCO|nr:hypothetical protein BIN_B_04450 [Mycobacterium riyadhense]
MTEVFCEARSDQRPAVGRAATQNPMPRLLRGWSRAAVSMLEQRCPNPGPEHRSGCCPVVRATALGRVVVRCDADQVVSSARAAVEPPGEAVRADTAAGRRGPPCRCPRLGRSVGPRPADSEPTRVIQKPARADTAKPPTAAPVRVACLRGPGWVAAVATVVAIPHAGGAARHWLAPPANPMLTRPGSLRVNHYDLVRHVGHRLGARRDCRRTRALGPYS